MHLDLIQSVSLCGDPSAPNDDRAGATPRRAWVIDGATDLAPAGLVGEQGGAAWLAATADAAFGSADAEDLREACAQVFARVERAFAAARRREAEGAWELPSASFAAVQVAAGAIDLAWAGDCAVLHRSGARAAWLTPQPDRAAESAAAAALGEGVGAHRERSPALLADRRAARARPGREVLGVDARASAAATRHARFAAAPDDALLLMSDGFSALVDAYGRHDAPGLFAAVETRGLAALAIELRAVEEEDAACLRYPRFKRSDDATALWLRVG